MLAAEARSLITRLEKGSARHLAGRMPMDASVQKVLAGKPTVEAERRALNRLLVKDAVAFDAANGKLVATASHMRIDRHVRPLDHSAVPGWTTVEQCMEFVMRYCRTVRRKLGFRDGGFGGTWKKQYNLAVDVEAMANGTLKKRGYAAHLNGGAVPPRAGDVLAMQGPVPAPGQNRRFHVALVTDTYKKGPQWYARVYEANVPYHQNPKAVAEHLSEIPMTVQDGRFTLARVPTGAKGYVTPEGKPVDMDPVGWIHPDASKALPGATP